MILRSIALRGGNPHFTNHLRPRATSGNGRVSHLAAARRALKTNLFGSTSPYAGKGRVPPKSRSTSAARISTNAKHVFARQNSCTQS